ncbi:MAG: alpha/beta fold hydrolase [Candidatus Brennerbacteria bacterium]
MNTSLEYVRTGDKTYLVGPHFRVPRAKTVLVNVHGTASNFYENDWLWPLAEKLRDKGIATISTNNRGAYVLEGYQQTGSAIERFEDCVQDIDAWIQFARRKGYRKIILAGHSLGTEKAVYYMQKGKFRSAVTKLVLLAPADSYGTEMKFLGKRRAKVFREAKKLVRAKRGYEFINSIWNSHAGVLPKSANSFLNFFGEKSELLKALPFHRRALPGYQRIHIPILVVIGDGREYTAIPIRAALALLSRENSLTKTLLLKHCNHDFTGNEEILAHTVTNFIAQ